MNHLSFANHLAVDHLKKQFVRSYLGVVWALIHPATTIVLYWFVLTYGLKAVPVADHPFFLWLLAGMIPWFFIAEGVSLGTTAILESASLVNQPKFPVYLLPLSRILRSIYVHLVFLVLLLVVMALFGRQPSVTWLFLGYGILAGCLFQAGLTLMTSAIAMVVKDVIQVVSMFVQIGFWATPIFWPLTLLPAWALPWFELNPIHHLVTTYRAILLEDAAYLPTLSSTISFWICTFLLIIIGVYCYRRIKPHFAEFV